MSELHHANSFRDQIVYQKARNAARDIFQLSKTFPRDEMYSLTDQVRRSSRSVGAQIAEAWGERAYERHFVSKLTDADSEQLESQHWIDVAFDCGYLTKEQQTPLLALFSEIGKMLHSMIGKANQFCGVPISER